MTPSYPPKAEEGRLRLSVIWGFTLDDRYERSVFLSLPGSMPPGTPACHCVMKQAGVD